MGTHTTQLKIRASAVGVLMTGGTGITAKQLSRLADLEARKNGMGKPLTANMEAELSDLIEKRDTPPQLGQSAKSYIESVFLQNEYGYREPVVTDVLLKGNMCEQDGIALISDVLPCNEFRSKCKRYFEDDFFTGNPDILLKDVIEDIKNAWSLKTFFQVKELDPLYYAQGQVYMHLSGRRLFRVHHCLVNTPIELIHAEQKRYFWKYGGDENNKHFKEAVKQIDANHTFDHIPKQDRVKTFEFEYNEPFIEELKGKVMLARQYYSTLKL